MGYWEPHSSSIDFCESNYLYFDRIAEFHNTWSSLLGLSLFGLIGLLYPYSNPTKEWRFILAYGTLFVIGLGSSALHGTLHWIYQSSDELPMIYLTHCLLYMCVEFDAPRFQPNYAYLPHFLILSTLVLTVLYYTYQQVYLVFIFVFTVESIFVLYAFHRILVHTSHPSVLGKKWAYRGVFAYVLVGFPLWLIDMLQCHRVLSIVNHSQGLFSWKLLRGATPHVIWHFGSGYGAYCFILSMICVRMEKLNIPYVILFQSRIFPFIPAIVPVDTTTQKKVDYNNNYISSGSAPTQHAIPYFYRSSENEFVWGYLLIGYIPTILYESIVAPTRLHWKNWIAKQIAALETYHVAIWTARNAIAHSSRDTEPTDQQLIASQTSALSWYDRQHELRDLSPTSAMRVDPPSQ